MKPLAMALLLTLGAYLTTRDALAVVFVVGAGFWVWVAMI